MFQRIFALLVLAFTLVSLQGCAVEFHPGNLTIGGGGTYATNKSSDLMAYDNVTGNSNGTRYSSNNSLRREKYRLTNGDVCERTWSEGVSVQNAPGKRNDYLSRNYNSVANCEKVTYEDKEKICFIRYQLNWNQSSSRSSWSNQNYQRDTFRRENEVCRTKPKS